MATAFCNMANSQSTAVLFARASRNSDAILPINDCAALADPGVPAFYCVHSVSGAAGTDFLDLARQLDSDVRFYGIQAPPTQIEAGDFGQSIESLADYYVEALVRFQPEGRILLGGYCVGAVIALAMANNLCGRGREVGPLIAIDGVPENTAIHSSLWKPRYALELMQNVRGWLKHADLMRAWSMRSLIWSVTNNASAIGKRAIGLRRGEKWGGGYSIEGIMDVSRYHRAHRSFINRLFAALFTYAPPQYPGEVVVYEAQTTPLLYLPEIGRRWSGLAPASKVVRVVGTHISMMRQPYVGALASDLRARITEFFAARKA
jgi:thioesterase domain-containing protein